MNRKKPLQRKTPLKRSAFPHKAHPKPKPKFLELKTGNPKLSNSTFSKPKKPYKWKKKPKKNQDFYDGWGARQDHCHCCGIDRELAAVTRFPGTSTHHIAKAGRVHTATNLLHLCARCHDLAENLDTPVWLPDGTKFYYPKLSFAACHWLKAHFYAGEYDAERLAELRKQVLEMEEPHPLFLAERYARRGEFMTAAKYLKKAREDGFPGFLDDILGAKMQPG